MIIRLDSVAFERFNWEERLELSLAELAHPEILELSPVSVRGFVEAAAPDFLLEARLRFGLTSMCARCTQPVLEEIDSELNLMLVRAESKDDGEAEVGLGEEDLGIVEVASGEFDTRPLIAEQVLLELPARPLCREDCAGLCISCGADLNAGRCDCRESAVDSRWGAALAAIKSEMDGGA